MKLGRIGEPNIFLQVFLVNMRNLTCEDHTFESSMQHTVNSESMSALRLHCRCLVTRSLIRVEHNGLCLIMCCYFADRAILGMAPIALLHLLNYAKQLALSETLTAIGGALVET